MAKEMTQKEVAAYIKSNFLNAVKPHEISESQLESYVESVMRSPHKKVKSEVKNFCFYSLGLTWKF